MGGGEAREAGGGSVSQPVPVTMWAGANTKRTIRTTIDCWGKGYEGKPPCPLYEAKGCKEMMMPQFAIIEAPGIGVYQLDTGSEIGIGNAYGFLKYLKTITGGRISGIPLQLHVVPQDVAPDGKKKTIHVVKLEAAFSLMELAERLKQAPMAALLPPPDESDLGEFYAEEKPPVEAEVVEEPAPALPSRELSEKRDATLQAIKSFVEANSVDDFKLIAQEVAPSAIDARGVLQVKRLSMDECDALVTRLAVPA